MAKISVPEKLRRILTFLYGLRDPRASSPLAAHGLDSAELQHGWSLFLAAARGIMAEGGEPQGEEIAGALAELDSWENKWFPIARASLNARYPAVADQVFLNLTQATGREVILTVQTFLDRVDPLFAAAAGTDNASAGQLLRSRRLTADACDRARALLSRIQDISLPATPAPPPPADRDAAVAAAWSWFQEWAEIARVVVLRKDLRIRLGVSQPTDHTDKPKPADEDDDA